MAIEYIDKKGGIAGETTNPAEKIKILMKDRRQRTNPFIDLRAVPAMEEGGKNGGVVRFRTLMGLAAATRRNGVETGNTYTYGNNLTLNEVVLTITEPLETPNGELIPTSRSDVAQLDGIDFTPVAASKTANILVDGETKEDVRAITEDANTRIITYDDTVENKFTEMRFAAHRAIASYYDVSDANAAYWTNAAVFDYFDAGSYSFTPEEIRIFANPSDIAEMSLELLNFGASNGDGVYQEAIQGKVPMIAGIEIRQTRYVPKGELWVSVLGVLGAPTQDVQYTMIKTSEDAKGNLGTYGKHYYNSILTNPELFTRVIPAVVLPGVIKSFEDKGKLFKKEFVIDANSNINIEERIQVIEQEIKELEGHYEKANDAGKARIKKAIASKKDVVEGLKSAK